MKDAILFYIMVLNVLYATNNLIYNKDSLARFLGAIMYFCAGAYVALYICELNLLK